MDDKFYVTTAIPYVNASPHIGQALEFVQADVIARYHRLLGEDTYFLTGTDENAHKNYLVAQEKGIPVEDFVEKHTNEFLELLEKLQISNDDFIRTTDQKRHWPGVYKLWKRALKNGDIYKKKYEGLYCVGCEAFVTEKDLQNGLCPIHQKPPEKVSEENYFFRLSKYQKKLEKLISTDELHIIPESRKNEVLSFVRSGLDDLSISRDRKRVPWGIPVPDDPTQTIYVWYDALTNYLSALGYGQEKSEIRNSKLETYWPADVHVIGKDITRFHAIYWPAFLLSAGLPLPKQILVHGFFTVEGQKMSKTIGNVLNPLDIIEEYGAETLRYYLLKRGALFHDADFSVGELEATYNADLANGLGNLISRVAKLCEKSKLDFVLSDPRSWANKNLSLRSRTLHFSPRSKSKNEKLEEYKFNEALGEVWQKIAVLDKFIDEEKPWELTRNKELRIKNKGRLEKTLQSLVGGVRGIAVLLKPFLPETSVKIQKQFAGPEIRADEPLFPRIK